jgi:hypothetical protein
VVAGARSATKRCRPWIPKLPNLVRNSCFSEFGRVPHTCSQGIRGSATHRRYYLAICLHVFGFLPGRTPPPIMSHLWAFGFQFANSLALVWAPFPPPNLPTDRFTWVCLPLLSFHRLHKTKVPSAGQWFGGRVHGRQQSPPEQVEQSTAEMEAVAVAEPEGSWKGCFGRRLLKGCFGRGPPAVSHGRHRHRGTGGEGGLRRRLA